MKHYVHTLFFMMMISSVSVQAGCLVYSCDSTIRYAIGRYSDKTVLRLDDYRKTIEASQKSEALHTKVLAEQNRELAKMLERVILENIAVNSIAFESKEAKAMN